MKKFLVFFFSLALLTSCSNDDDNTDTDQPDPIIGTWVLVDASSGIDELFCPEPESTIKFNANNTGEATFYLAQSECEPESSAGNWENNGNSKYTISLPVLGNVSGTANFVNENRFTFTTALGVITFERQ